MSASPVLGLHTAPPRSPTLLDVCVRGWTASPLPTELSLHLFPLASFHSPCWPRTLYADGDDLELLIPLPASLHPVYVVLVTEPRASCMLGKHSELHSTELHPEPSTVSLC